MGNQSASRLGGDDYQHLLSWFELLRLLDDDGPYDHGYVEHPAAGAADDVTLHPKPGAATPSRYLQIKWHTRRDHLYTTARLMEVQKPGRTSLLQKLFKSWQALVNTGPVEIWLISNWAPAPAPDLGLYLDGHGHKLRRELFTTPAGRKLCAPWRPHLGTDAKTLEAFCRDLRLNLPFVVMADLEEMVDHAMQARGLRSGENPRLLAIGQVRYWIQERDDPSKRITAARLREAITRRDLWQPNDCPTSTAPSPPPWGVGLWIHGMAKLAWDDPHAIELDWTAHFSTVDGVPRRALPDAAWPVLRRELDAVKRTLSASPDGARIDFRGKLPQSVLLAVGLSFPTRAGFTLRAEQPSPSAGEIFLWRSQGVAPSAARFRVDAEPLGDGEDVLVFFWISRRASDDALRLARSGAARFRLLLEAAPEAGPGHAAVRANEDMAALVSDAQTVLERATSERRGTGRIHLVLCGPATFALFLGQRLNALGDIVTYERARGGTYERSLTICTD